MDTVAVMVRVSLGNNEMKLSLQNTGFTTSFVFSLCIIKWLKKDNLSEFQLYIIYGRKVTSLRYGF